MTAQTADRCLIVHPADTPLSARCPRCGGLVAEHPAPMSLLPNPDVPPADRPTFRLASLVAEYDAWSNQRADLSAFDGVGTADLPEGMSPVSSSDWHDSDDTGCDLADRMATALRAILNPPAAPAASGKALVAGIERAIQAALDAPAVEPIVMAEVDEDGRVLFVTPHCPECGCAEIVEVEYGNVAINTTEADLQGDELRLDVSQWDRDRHTLAFACANAECHTFLDLEDWSVSWG